MIKETCGKCEWYDPEEEIKGETGCCMRFLVHVEENAVADKECFRERK